MDVDLERQNLLRKIDFIKLSTLTMFPKEELMLRKSILKKSVIKKASSKNTQKQQPKRKSRCGGCSRNKR
jgi:hypothetical protein